MGLVDYSDSESDSEPVAQPEPAPAPISTSQSAPASGKRPFQKVVDRAKPGKILVNLPQSASGRGESKPTDGDDAPPTKRAKIGGRGGGAFSGFNSFLPPPKNVGKKPIAASGSGSTSSGIGKPASRPVVNLKTGAAPGFSRETNENSDGGVGETVSRSEDSEPAAKQPSIPAEQKPADEVKLVGKPLMFRPLSVSRKPNKKGTLGKPPTAAKATTTPKAETVTPAPTPKEASPPPKKREKISLFSLPDEQTPRENDTNSTPTTYPSTYEPMFQTTPTDEFAAYDAQNAITSSTQPPPSASATTTSNQSLDALASSMNLSAAARRELFGRGGTVPDSRVVNFDTDREYAHNEALRASGQLQPAYNPIRAIAPGKHNLRQLVSQVQNQRDALEESFATGKGKRNEAGAQYGWR
ncbi:mitotic checkpoint regulator, MAD2B-interacting-domain-containing protein [Annulohypoxylon maeteangense]|uniref:mitotic checkpoint regulator, MAD2B-interacting-domain-containing protein n=1 Tax=Annulohypoxylon maeteangense TaxID=1927788 RepID=UPI002007F255|nr:mitotic checkpoint regulator, MAD2B-interacting-domain-containing protein [Annulohypoxylon maeteangense]KAI0887250.1 mitotic checkpoint regulator, MAD2B-interacting-domain-containing protein [Annulohypoxylon maeteangense]